MEKEDEKKKEEMLQHAQKKETFEPLEMKIVDVKVEKGYATSGHNDPVTIQQWKNGNW
ncbi:hypothetical protein [uncultured Bacteroides sp.]|uniref:hypothetical protein n=1 Tax=uncultured Bacteroides sp. TaxID=162156 RepID=UPI002AA6944A|nr:hypothetical protein [uncultured Bacteroides sp.]